MSDTVICAKGLSKRYVLSQKANGDGLRHIFHNCVTAPVRWLTNGRNHQGGIQNGSPTKKSRLEAEFWALKDISFEVKKGEVIGIIGRNGAGKSTLLKILSRITEQTEGRVEISGRVASLLEVGTGFHPELSGRENIYLNGAILGMSRTEIKRKFDEIVSFAEVDKFLDLPVKRYSSGMYVRLAFAVAAHLEPEILIVDEVLAVGDAAFQKKCLGKMQDVAHGSGRTILFVSHNMGAVMSLCDRGIYLKKGQVVLQDTIEKVTHAYLSDGVEQGFQIQFDASDPAAGDEVVRVHQARILGPDGKPQGAIRVGDEAWLEVEYQVMLGGFTPRLNLHFCTEDGTYAFASIENTESKRTMGSYSCRMQLPANFLNGKSYLISIYLSSFELNRVHVELKDVLVLNVVDDPNSVTRQTYTGSFPGALRPVLRWEVKST